VQIKEAVLAACAIRYVRYPADQTPSIPELQLLVPLESPSSATEQEPVPTMPVLLGGRAAAVRSLSKAVRWPDSGYLKGFAVDRDGHSGFSHSLPSIPPEGGVVIDTLPPLRH
jgi:hypothetical protein